MEWLEIIEIRAIGNNREKLKLQLQDLIYDLRREAELKSVKIYGHISLETDFSIHLLHYSENPNIGCSLICSRLVPSLKDFGLVNHKVWVETYNNEKRNESKKYE